VRLGGGGLLFMIIFWCAGTGVAVACWRMGVGPV
jgi:hypothetical protein